MTEYLTPRQIFLMVLVLTTTLSVFGFWRPRSVFSHTYDNPHAKGADFPADLKRLLKHRAIYPVVLINLLWNFTPALTRPCSSFSPISCTRRMRSMPILRVCITFSFFCQFYFMDFCAPRFRLASCCGGL